MADLLVRSVPGSVVETLQRRAARNRRSMQQEMLLILEAAAVEPEGRTAAEIAQEIRARLSGERRAFTDSTPLVREDRER